MKNPSKPRRMGIAHHRHPLAPDGEPSSKKRKYNDFQSALLASSTLIKPSPSPSTASGLPSPTIGPSAPFNFLSPPPHTPETPLPLHQFLISTTVNGQTSLIFQSAASTVGAPLTKTSDPPGVSSSSDPALREPDDLHIPGNDLFGGDPLLVEEFPSTVLVPAFSLLLLLLIANYILMQPL